MGATRTKKPMPDDFPVLATQMKVHDLLKHFRIGRPTLSLWTKQAGLTRKSRTSHLKPVPDDFATVAPTLLKLELRKRYNAGDDVITRWLIEANVEARQVERRAMPSDFAEHARETIAQLRERYDCPQQQISKWRKQLGLNLNKERQPRGQYKAKQGPIRPARFRGHPIPPTPQADASLAGRAADYLKRYFVPVCKSETIGKPKGGYIVGRIGMLPPEEMIALAERKGFDAREWARCA